MARRQHRGVFDRQPGLYMPPLTHAVDIQIGNLRKNIDRGDGVLITETVHGPGLRLNVSEP